MSTTCGQPQGVVKSLLDSDCFQVRALTRNPQLQQAQLLVQAGAEVVPAPLELGREKDWRQAFAGATGAFLMMPPIGPQDSWEYELGCALADAAVHGGVEHIVFSTLENVDQISRGALFAPHFTDKALVADYIRSLDV